MWKIYRGPSIRLRHRKYWSVSLAAAAVVAVAALLILGLSDGRSAQAQTTTAAVVVGAGDIASCTSTGDEATAKLLGSISGTATVFTAGDTPIRKAPWLSTTTAMASPGEPEPT